MLDQSFSIKNYVKIFYDENRKGNYTEGKFFPELKALSTEISTINEELKLLRNSLKKNVITQEDYDTQRNLKNVDKNLLFKKKQEQLINLLPKITKKIVDKNFRIELVISNDKGGKPIYLIKKKPEYFFAIKQLQKNIKLSFSVRQADRFKILSQVTKVLGDGCPKYILRTDISSFYESIPHDKLKETLDKNLILSQLSKKIIKGLLWEYKDKTNSQDIGLPRGVGVSAYLSELYMKDIDSKIKAHPNVTYYARYVDDMIIIFTPNNKNETIDYKNEIKEIIEEKESGLTLNNSKTNYFDLRSSNGNYNFEFLGYKISGNLKKTELNISLNRDKRYRQRIDTTFEAYNNDSKHDEKKARKMLINRIRFLTFNTHLNNAKNNIVVGAYFSNSLLSDTQGLHGLDQYLKSKINNHLVPYSSVNVDINKLKNRLLQFSFVDGFKEKKHTKFNANQLNDIFKIWKNIG
jgi:Reverse transcriptase (RNA-dependent DNA polymerase)